MIEAGAPSTEEVAPVYREVPAPPGLVMVAPLEVPRNAETAQSIGRANEKERKQRGRGQYKGWGPTHSFAAAKLGSLILREDCYNVVT